MKDGANQPLKKPKLTRLCRTCAPVACALTLLSVACSDSTGELGGAAGLGAAAAAGTFAAAGAASLGGSANASGSGGKLEGTSGATDSAGSAGYLSHGGAGGSAGAGAATAGAGGNTSPHKFAGNITTHGAVRSDFKGYWDQITPENEGKWGSVQPSQNTWKWEPLDAIYKYAGDNHIAFKEHCFVWGAQQPGWVNDSNAQTAVRTWMQKFCERYPDTKLIDVVNEPPPHTTPAYMNGIGGPGASGYDWIVNAFKWAHEFCPNSVLLLNDYNDIEQSGDNSHIIDIVKKIKAAGAPIDAVGAQAHGAYNTDTAKVKSYIDQIAMQTGLPVYITEYDINLADDAKQKSVMADQFTMFWTNPNVRGVTLWGYVQGATWLPNTGLMSSSGVERPALTWLKGYLGR